MKKFKVIALSVGGSNNRIFHSGDIVDESNFPKGNAELLVEKDFLKPIIVEDEIIDEEIVEDELNIDSMNKKQIIAELEAKNIEFSSSDNKETLFNLLVS